MKMPHVGPTTFGWKGRTRGAAGRGAGETLAGGVRHWEAGAGSGLEGKDQHLLGAR